MATIAPPPTPPNPAVRTATRHRASSSTPREPMKVRSILLSGACSAFISRRGRARAFHLILRPSPPYPILSVHAFAAPPRTSSLRWAPTRSRYSKRAAGGRRYARPRASQLCGCSRGRRRRPSCGWYYPTTTSSGPQPKPRPRTTPLYPHQRGPRGLNRNRCPHTH